MMWFAIGFVFGVPAGAVLLFIYLSLPRRF